MQERRTYPYYTNIKVGITIVRGGLEWLNH